MGVEFLLTVISPAETAACCAPLSAQPLTMEQAEQVAPLLKALADPVRLRLMSLVASRQGGEACVCDLNDAFDLSQPTISHHMKVLHEAGLVDRDKRGVWVYYRVRPQALAGLGALIGCPGRAARPAPAGLPFRLFIVYRRLTMNDVQPLDRQTAETYAAWFKALADGTRVQVVSLLARAGRPLTVKEIVAAVPVGQSTVSEHLRQLAAVGFVLAEERGTSRLYRINGDCVSCFPTAADLVMGKPSPVRRFPQDDHGSAELIVTRSGRRSPPGTRAWPGPRRPGQAVTDCDPGAGGRLRRAGYPDAAGLPEGAVRASLGCGNPVAVADLRPGRRCWTWAAAAASTCCCRLAGSARPGRRTAWT